MELWPALAAGGFILVWLIFWTYGGDMVGRSAAHLKYLREIIETLPFQQMEPDLTRGDGRTMFCLRKGTEAYLFLLTGECSNREVHFGLYDGTRNDYRITVYDLLNCKVMKELEIQSSPKPKDFGVPGTIAIRAVRKKVKKRNCPICSSRIKHDYCYSCKKTFKEVEKEYNDKVETLASQGLQLLVSGEVKTMGTLCSKLNISDKLGADVIATLKNEKLVKVKGIASKLMAKAVTTSISTAISAILWITIGGFAILSTWMLITVLLLALLLPILITKYFQWRAKRQLVAD